MGYYRGDYYRGDYYRGDFGSFIKKAAKGAIKIAGTIIGGAAGAELGAPAIGAAAGGLAGQAVGGMIFGTDAQSQTAGTTAPPARSAPTGGSSLVPMGTAVGGTAMVPASGAVVTQGGQVVGRPPGYHLNKSDSYYRLPNGNVAIHPKGTLWVRNRTMNPLNIHALRRGIRRMKGAEATFKTVMRLSHPGKSGGTVHFKGKSRKRS